ncbi:MAG TPA: DUF4387 domain-containing protein [Caulobacteraceae bacterium]|nr:DUF4387 domain-containing protein [Caulobacteraceae bacterium]
MARLRDVCRYVRSKNAGPFWITLDLFFDGEASYARYRDAPPLSSEAVARLYGVDPTLVRRYPVDGLSVLKISYPRATPQGGAGERDMHGGQQYVRLLDVELDGV